MTHFVSDGATDTDTLAPPRAATVPDGPLYHNGIYYPDEDSEPMADNEHQAIAMNYAYLALRLWFRKRGDVHVISDMFVYYVEGDRFSNFAPDVAVIIGARGKHRRNSWMVWREGVVPTLIIEFSSPRTRRDDAIGKRELYARIGVGEYWRVDPIGTQPIPVIAGDRLVNGRYEPIDVSTDESGVRRGHSATLGLDLCVRQDGEFRLYDPAAREWLLSMSEEAQDALEQSDAARRQAEDERRQAEDEVRRLRELLAGRNGT